MNKIIIIISIITIIIIKFIGFSTRSGTQHQIPSKTKVVAVVVGALGTMSDNLNKEIEDIQNIALWDCTYSKEILHTWLIDRRTDIERTNIFVYVHSI